MKANIRIRIALIAFILLFPLLVLFIAEGNTNKLEPEDQQPELNTWTDWSLMEIRAFCADGTSIPKDCRVVFVDPKITHGKACIEMYGYGTYYSYQLIEGLAPNCVWVRVNTEEEAVNFGRKMGYVRIMLLQLEMY